MSDIFEMLKETATLYNKGLKQGGRMTHENPFHEIKSGSPKTSEIAPMTVHVVDGSFILLATGGEHEKDIGQIWNREHAHKIAQAVNSYESDQKKIKALVEAAKSAKSALIVHESYGHAAPDIVKKLKEAIHQGEAV